jgi:hypothetical protein
MVSRRIEATVVYSAQVMPEGSLQDIKIESARTTAIDSPLRLRSAAN